MKVADLIPDNRNANRGTQRGLAALDSSLRKHGAGRSILIDKNNRVIAGNKTTERAADIGLDDVIVVETDGSKLVAVKRIDLDLETDKAARELAYADNRVGQLDLEWEPLTLAADLEAGLDLGELFRPEEISAILEAAGTELLGKGSDPGPQEDKAKELQAKWQTAAGQVWQLGRHRLACGDCTDRATVDAVMRGERAAIAIMDPPYGMHLDTDYTQIKPTSRRHTEFERAKGATTNKNYRPVIGDNEDYNPVPVMQFIEGTKEQFWWGADYYADSIPNRKSGSWLVWDKRSNDDVESSSLDEMFGSAFELCWSRQPHKRSIIRAKFAGLFGTETQDTKQRLHPTQKAVQVIEWILVRYSGDGDTCADFYLGSGTTLIACENLNRQARCIEIDPGYCAVSIQRWVDLTGKEPVLIH